MKVFKKWLKHLYSPFTVGLAVTLGIVYLSFVYYAKRHSLSKEDHSFASILEQLHMKTIDWRLTDRGFAPGSDRVAVLAVDEKSIEQEGRWPWPRDKQGKLVDKVIEYGGKVIAFDIVYAEEDQNSSIPSLRRVSRGLSSKQVMNPEIKSLIDSEILQTDGDRIFAEIIKKRADNFVLGAYFDVGGTGNPLQEFCLDSLYERSHEARYWGHESIPLTVIDEPLTKMAFPREIKDHLSGYFTSLEISHSATWFDSHKDLNPRIADALDDIGVKFPPETFPGVATLWLNNDIDNAKTLLEQINPALANSEGVRLLFNRFGSALTKQEAASLSAEVRSAGKDYCDRFLSEGDELASADFYKKIWTDSPEALETFAQFSWANLWPGIQSKRLPANTDGALETFDMAMGRFRSQALKNRITQVERWWVNIPLLSDQTKHTGYFNAEQDSDGSIRHAMMTVRKGNSYMPALALKAFLLDKGYNAVVKIDAENVGRKEATEKVVKSFEINDAEGNTVMTVPVDERGRMMINYAGGRNMFPYVSAADVLNDSPKMVVEVQEKSSRTGRWEIIKKEVDKKEFLKDKLFVFGATAIGVYDLRVTPFEENYPGVETHANVLSNLLVEHARAKGDRMPASAPGFLRVHPQEERTMWILLLGIGLVLSALLTYFGSLPGLGITAIFMGGVYAIDRFWLFRSGIVTTVIFPMFEIAGTFVTLTFYKYFTEERKKRELKGTFEKYVSPAIVAEVLADPENIELGGKKMELTVMFSDVRGFTTISEKLDPRQLSDLLNSYLTPMTDLVFKNKGTLDKYMGDAIMAFWGAPIHFPDHAAHACRCALQMLTKLKELQAEYRSKGLPEIDIGIGLNTGEMNVGNMGSETVRSYTVMGDSVNLGSRLEGINKQYGTRIIISEFTQKEIKDGFVTREVDWVRVKGKQEPVRIFELVAEGTVEPDVQKALEYFEQGFKLYHERKFQEAIAAFQEGLKTRPDDAPTQLYLERCQDYLAEPPPEDWDGVYNMKSK